MKEVKIFCNKCCLLLKHRATAESGDTIYKVQCLTCNTEKNFKEPAKKKAPVKKKVRKNAVIKCPPPEDLVRVSYHMHKIYFVGDVMVHPDFGEGEILTVVDNIATCAFPKGQKMLMTNRR